MAAVIIRDAPNRRDFIGTQGKKMFIYAETSGLTTALTMSTPYAPVEIAYDGITQEWSEIERSGAKPLLMRKGDNLLTMKFSLRLVNKDTLYSQAGNISLLKRLSKSRERVLVRYGSTEAGLWRITECSISSSRRHPDTNEVTDAVASLTLTEASDAAPAVGPVRPPPPKPKPAAKPKKTPRTYVVKKGDCLWKIAQRYYGRGTLWPRIFDANRKKIKNPHWIYPGQRFVIP